MTVLIRKDIPIYDMPIRRLERSLADGSLSVPDCFVELLFKYEDQIKSKNYQKAKVLKGKIDHLFNVLGDYPNIENYKHMYSNLENDFKDIRPSYHKCNRTYRTRKGITFDILIKRILEKRALEKQGLQNDN